MPTSTVPVPAGWPSIKIAYSGITTKLSEQTNSASGQSVTVTLAMRVAAIGYWRSRLVEDEALVRAGRPPATTSSVVVPAGWPNIKMAYEGSGTTPPLWGITPKLAEQRCVVNGQTVLVTLAMRLDGINYWRLRLAEDEALVRAGRPPATAPPPPPP